MATSDVQVATESASPRRRLSGGLGPGAIIFMVLAAAAPLAVVGGVLPVGALTGNGSGMPGTFLVAGAILMFFAVGLSAMTRHVARPGAFFTYVGYGLGRPGGVAAAWMALLTYTAMQVAVLSYLGLILGQYVDDKLDVILPWWFWTLALIVVVGALGYRRVELSSKVLGVVLVVEVGIVLVLALVIVAQGGADGLSADPFRPSQFMSGNPALALMWAMAGYAGFESTAIYRDEAREPERTVPRATYGALILIALFYTFASWALVQGWGDAFEAKVADTTSSFILATTDRYLGGVGAEIINVLLLTSFFACVLSLHNVTARYGHAMANAGLLPRPLGRVHERHQSPHLSSLTLSVLLFVLLGLFAVIDLDPYLQIYTWVGGFGTVAVVLLMALTCIAVIAYLNRRETPEGPWRTLIAPGIGLVGLLFVSYLLFENLPMLLGDVDAAGNLRVGGLSLTFYAVLIAVPAFGLAQGLWLKRARPATYESVIESISE